MAKTVRAPKTTRRSIVGETKPKPAGLPAGPRPSWRGLVSFGLVNVPVNLYPAVKPEIHGMNYLRKDDLCPIAYKKVCRATGEEVPFDDIVRGYEYRDGDYVVLDDEDFRKADVKKSSAIEIEAFVDGAEIDPKYVEKPYYLEPQAKAQTAYALLRDAMIKAGKVAIGLFVLRDREHLVMLKPEGPAILLIQLRFAASLRSSAGLDLPGRIEAPKAQMDLALELVKKFSGEFRPEAYADTYAARLRAIIAAKAKGRTVHVRAEEAPRETEVDDIMARLKDSLSATRH